MDYSLKNCLRTDDVEIGFMLTRERGGRSIFIHSGGAYSRDKVWEAVASHQVRDRADDFITEVMRMDFIHYRHRQGEAIWYAMVHSGKAAEICRLATD